VKTGLRLFHNKDESMIERPWKRWENITEFLDLRFSSGG
jgi:hypothetical protein